MPKTISSTLQFILNLFSPSLGSHQQQLSTTSASELEAFIKNTISQRGRPALPSDLDITPSSSPPPPPGQQGNNDGIAACLSQFAVLLILTA